jgi:hypothetical protein
MPEFIPGLALNEAFYWQAICPILDRHYPYLPHAAARIGACRGAHIRVNSVQRGVHCVGRCHCGGGSRHRASAAWKLYAEGNRRNVGGNIARRSQLWTANVECAGDE